MKRKLIVFISVLALMCSVLSVFALVGCSDKPKVTQVSTAEEFAAAKGIISLKNDIDFDNQVVVGTNKVVYGNGHKLSNAVFGSYGFAIGTKDLTIENFTLKGKGATSFGFVASIVPAKSWTEKLFFPHYYFDETISNVHIVNCKVELELAPSKVCTIGGLIGKTVMEGQYYQEDKSEVNITNCSVEGLEVTVTRPAASSFWDKSGEIYFGGLVGDGMDVKMSNCFVKDCKFSVTAGHTSDNINMGGLMGRMNSGSEMSHCYVKDTTLEANNDLRTGQSVTGGRVTADNKVGGLVCDGRGDNKITACYAEGNEIISSASGKSYVGGISCIAFCPITECYAVDNTFTCKGRATDDTYSVDFRVGGIAALTNKMDNGGSFYPVSINSSFAFNNNVDIELKDVNSKYFYLSNQKVDVCKNFIGEYFALYKEDHDQAAQFLADTLNRDDVDKEAVQEFIDDMNKRLTEVSTDNDSVAHYLDTYITFLNDKYKQLDIMYVGGLLGTTIKNVKVNKCAADINATHYFYDRFCRTLLEEADYNKNECYVTGGAGVNNRGCVVLTTEQTYGNSLIEKLGLTDEKWTVSDNGLPVLSI